MICINLTYSFEMSHFHFYQIHKLEGDNTRETNNIDFFPDNPSDRSD